MRIYVYVVYGNIDIDYKKCMVIIFFFILGRIDELSFIF